MIKTIGRFCIELILVGIDVAAELVVPREYYSVYLQVGDEAVPEVIDRWRRSRKVPRSGGRAHRACAGRTVLAQDGLRQTLMMAQGLTSISPFTAG